MRRCIVKPPRNKTKQEKLILKPAVEFRGIPTMLAHTEIEAFALNFHKYIQNLNTNARGKTHYGKQP